MTSSMYFLLILLLFLVLDAVQGTLEPHDIVSVDCGSTQTFTCRTLGEPLGWNITGLSGISIPGPFRARPAALANNRITSSDTGGDKQFHVSVITISGFSISDNGGIIQCINMEDGSVRGMASISIKMCDGSFPNTLTPDTASGPTDKQTGLASLAALVVLIPVVLLIALIYPLGVFIAKYYYFKDKSYCEAFWWCSSERKDELSTSKSTEVLRSPRSGVDAEKNQANKDGKEGIQYAALDFSGQHKGKNVTHSIEAVMYADV